MKEFSYEITPRLDVFGGGWRLQLFEDGEEVGGGAYPVTATETADDAVGIPPVFG